MRISYNEIFKYTEILNPISPSTLLLAGEIAKLDKQKIVIDLGSGKGYPSLLWASVFGVQVEGFDVNKKYVGYANSRAEMLNLSQRVNFFHRDVKKLEPNRRYNVVASLGLGIRQVYGSITNALEKFKTYLYGEGFLILAEPVWLVKPVPSEVLKALDVVEDDFLTKQEFLELFEKLEFQVEEGFFSSKEDWETYIKPAIIALKEIVESDKGLAREAEKIMDAFEAEYSAVDEYWDMILWVTKI